MEAYADGLIDLPAPAPSATKAKLRYAPSFVQGRSPPGGERRPYNAQSIGNFIGWLKPSGDAQDKVHDALAALELMEGGVLKESDFEELTTTQARAVVQEARRVMERRDADPGRHPLE